MFAYLIKRFIFRIKQFLRHWYINSFFIYSHFVVSFLEKLDKYFAFRINLRYLFNPLYQDRSIIGYGLGFIFRSSRLLSGSLIYLFIIVFAVFLYLIWLTAPIFIIYKIAA